MGCDIHFFVERRIRGIWTRVPDPIRTCWSCDGKKIIKDKPCWLCKGKGKHRESFWDDRSYDTFAILADVRNGYGFAGCKTGDGYRPIAAPRGVPHDVSPSILKAIEEYGEDGHSHSFLTVAEILAYDWKQTTKRGGVITAHQYQWWREHGRGQPEGGWSGGVSGPGIETVSEKQLQKLIMTGIVPINKEQPTERASMLDEPPAKDGKRYYTYVSWPVVYEDVAAGFLKVVHEELVPLGPPTDTRAVFFFDN